VTTTKPPWRPSAFLAFSVVVSTACVLLVALRPALWPVGLFVLLADQAVLLGSGFVPRTRLLGPNMSRLPRAEGPANRVALTFDDGPDPEVTPFILEMLAKHHVKATFFCVGSRADANPELVRAIAEAGHMLGNHSWSHTHAFWFLGPKRLAREVALTQRLLVDLGGKTPSYFRAPAGIRSPLLDPLLARHELALVSWTRRGFDTVDRDPQRILNRLVNSLAPGDILLLHDGSAARDSTGRPIVLEVLPRLLNVLYERGLEPVPLP